jgi:hypothetical protein
LDRRGYIQVRLDSSSVLLPGSTPICNYLWITRYPIASSANTAASKEDVEYGEFESVPLRIERTFQNCNLTTHKIQTIVKHEFYKQSKTNQQLKMATIKQGKNNTYALGKLQPFPAECTYSWSSSSSSPPPNSRLIAFVSSCLRFANRQEHSTRVLTCNALKFLAPIRVQMMLQLIFVIAVCATVIAMLVTETGD